jgi:hypothetical protein
MVTLQPRGDKDMRLLTAIARHEADTMPGTKLTLIRHGIDDWYQTAYNDGCVEGNHPVPAIRLEVDICKTWDNTVTIFTDRNGYMYEIGEQWS